MSVHFFGDSVKNEHTLLGPAILSLPSPEVGGTGHLFNGPNMTPDEKIAKLEVIAETNQGGISRMESKIDCMSNDLTEIKEKISKQNGYFAGAFSVIVVIWSALVVFVQHWWDRFMMTGEP